MNIVCLAMMDNGNYMKHVATGLRDYCNTTATAYVQNPPTYVNIPDKTVQRWTPPDYPDADFYVLNDHTYFHHYRHFRDKPRIVKCNGTFARDMGGWFQWDYLKHGTQYISSPLDFKLARALPFSIQTLGPLYDHRLLPEPDFSAKKIRVGHSPTNKFKGTKRILEMLHPYRKKGKIEIDMITETPWKECIQRKAKCHIFIDQAPPDVDHEKISRGAFGINAIESLAMGSIVLNEPLHPYVKHQFQFVIPIEDLTPENLAYHIKNKAAEIHTTEHWPQEHFDIKTQVPRLKEWIDWVHSPEY